MALSYVMQLLHATGLAALNDKAPLSGYRVFSVQATDETQAEALKELQKDVSFDFWTPISTVVPTDIMVKPQDIPKFLQLILALGIPIFTKIADVKKLIYSQKCNYLSWRKREVDWKNYNTIEEIHEWMENVAANNENLVKIASAGKSFEGRDLKIMIIGNGNQPIWIDATIHAREWIAAATTTYIMNELITSQTPEIKDLLKHFTWYFLPVQNPDGYAYTWSNFPANRLWRKNRRPIDKICTGVDPNRNFIFKFF